MLEKPNRRRSRPKVRTGVYYWLPTPFEGRVAWHLLPCHDLSFDCEAEHHHMWPAIVDRLATAWSWCPRALQRYLSGCEASLPRGRVDRSSERGRYLIHHGSDSPDLYWRCTIIDRFGLEGRYIEYRNDDGMRRLSSDHLVLSILLGVDISS